MREQLISVISGLVFGILGAFLSVNYSEYFSEVTALYFAFFAYISTTVALILSNTRVLKSNEKILGDVSTEISEVSDEISFIANYLRTQDTLSREGNISSDIFWSLSLLKARQGIHKLSKHGDFRVEKEEIPNFWLQAIINTDSSWLCTYTVYPNIEWKTGWVKKGIEYQKLGIETSGITATRIFIFDKKEDIDSDAIAMMKYNEESKIQVKWITRDSNSLVWSRVEDIEKELGTVNISIIDNSYLLAFKPSGGENLEHAQCISRHEQVKQIREWYSRLSDQSKNLSELTKES